MRNDTRLLFNQFATQVAKLNGVPNATQKFAVDPSVQQRLEKRIQESSDFLTRVNMIGVDELKGEKLALGVSGPIAGRTDVTSQDRQTRNLSTLDANGYECRLTEFDTHLGYNKIDAWAKFANFQALLRDAIVRQQALDRIMIGFNGTSAAAQTNRTTSPLLQDVNIGWLQHYRTTAPARVMSEGATAGTIKVGKSGDYANLDALVFEAVNELIDPWFSGSTDMVAIIGRSLLTDEYLPKINQWEQPTESRALDLIMATKRIGGVSAYQVPFFPDNTILVTTLDNLSVYWQTGARRRYVAENPKRNRIENYESSNDAYVVEDFGAGCLIENIQRGDFTAP